jgi:hypothetical protein
MTQNVVGSIRICAACTLVHFAIIVPSRQFFPAVVPKLDGWGTTNKNTNIKS